MSVSRKDSSALRFRNPWDPCESVGFSPTPEETPERVIGWQFICTCSTDILSVQRQS